MEEFVTFAANHWELVVAFIITFLLLMFNIFGDSIRGFESVTPEVAVRILNQEGALLIDVRTKDELSRDGRIKDASHIPLNELKGKLDGLSKHRAFPVAVICRSGSRSGVACSQLKKSGFEQVYNLKGGILSWKNASLPVSYK